MKISLLIVCLFYTRIATAQVSVLTQHNDLARTGLNQNETILNTSNVNQTLFGKIFTRPVDDQIYAQPLVVSGVVLPSVGKKDVVYVATVNNTLYAYDADDPAQTSPYWVDSLTPTNTVVVNSYDFPGACGGDYNTTITNNIGILSTPVIDTNTHTIFVLTADLVLSDSSYEQWLHAIDMRTGSEKSYSPIQISAKYQGNGDGSVNDTLYFDAYKELQRTALTLINGVVYITWASICDWPPYHGWIIGYDTTLKQKYVWMDTPNGYDGGIWMSGEGISSDGLGNLYVSVGNGSLDSTGTVQDTANLGESYIKLTPSGDSLKVKSFFTPKDWEYLDSLDLDLGTAGLLLIPNTSWAFSGGKQGVMYMVDRDSMGGVGYIMNHNLETFTIHGDSDGAFWANGVYGGPVYWKNDSAEYVYVWPAMTHLFAYNVDTPLNQLDSDAVMKSEEISPENVRPAGGMLSISADRTAIGTGIVWASLPLSVNEDAYPGTWSGILRAYDANNLNNMLWSSQQDSTRDSLGRWAKFVCPTVVNGKVYMATFSNQLVVYGLLNPTGLQQMPSANVVSLYPDPATDMVHYTTQHTINYIEIDNILGQTVQTFSNTTSQSFDVSTLAAGTYLVKFVNANSITVKKLVIEK